MIYGGKPPPFAMMLPPYGKRSDLVPSRQKDYGDGGAFPEILVEQYPLDMGRRRDDDSGVRGSVDVAFEAVIRQMENALKIACSSPGDTVSNVVATGAGENDESASQTNAASQNIIGARLSATQPAYPWRQPPILIKYKALPQSAASNSGSVDRIVRMMDQTLGNPCQPPKYKHKRLSRSAGRWPPVPVMSSPRRPPRRDGQSDWKVPPTDSSWKNPIPLDKRLESDGQQLRDAFAGLAEALYAAEKAAREASQRRYRLRREFKKRQKKQREGELRPPAGKARAERADDSTAPPVGSGKKPRELSEVMMELNKHRLLVATALKKRKKSEVTRAVADRDASERIALGMASTGGIVANDKRSGRPNMSSDSDTLGDAGEQINKVTMTDRFKPDEASSGASASAGGKRERPVDFDDVPEQDDDPLDINRFLTQFASLGMDDLGERLRSMLNIS